MTLSITLKKGREKSVLQKHPWIFSGAIAKVNGQPGMGDTVDVFSADNTFLARGAYSPQSQIRVRVWTNQQDQAIDHGFFRNKIEQAIAYRKSLINEQETTAYRLVFSESDGLPGLVVDKYGENLVCQFLSAAVEKFKSEIVSALQDLLSPRSIYERSDTSSRKKEGLPSISGVLAGKDITEFVEIKENNVKFMIDLLHGHKTGFYLDQRENRQLISKFSQQKDVLNCFSYSGGFGIYATLAGANSVIHLDSSEAALQLARANAEMNGLKKNIDYLQANVFHALRDFRERKQQFDLIILDPPKFAESGQQVKRAARAYKDINMIAFSILKPGGILFTFSCSGHLERQLFQKIVADAALDARREAKIVDQLHQASDHPVGLNFPESNYLKGLICHVSF